MSSFRPARDLVVLVADNDAELAVQGMLSRHQALRIRPIKWKWFSTGEPYA